MVLAAETAINKEKREKRCIWLKRIFIQYLMRLNFSDFEVLSMS